MGAIFVFVQNIIMYVCAKIIKNYYKFSKMEIVYLLLLGLLHSFLFIYIGVYTALVMIPSLLGLLSVYSYSIRMNLFAIFYSFIIGIISDHLIPLIEVSILKNFQGNFYIILSLWVCFSIFSAFLLKITIDKVKKTFEPNLLRKVQLFGTIIGGFTLITLYISVFIEVELGNTTPLILTNLFFFLFYTLITILIIYIYMRINRQHQKIKEKQIEFQALQNYTQSMEQSYNTLRKFRHDYKNMMISLDALLEEGDLLAIRQYIKQDMQREANKLLATRNNLDDLSKLNISPLKGLILAKLWQVNPQKVEVKLEINQSVDHINMDLIDCVKVVGILLDNAIEAVQEVGVGQIQLTCFQLQHSVHLVIDNTYQGDLVPTKQLFQTGYSTKGKERGLGLANVREIIAQYPAASLETQIKGQIFSQHLTIPA